MKTTTQPEQSARGTTQQRSKKVKSKWDDKHFSFTPLLDRGKFLNIVKSDRSDGKTTAMIDRVCKRFKANEGKFIICRRYKPEADKEFRKALLDPVHVLGMHEDLDCTVEKTNVKFNGVHAGWIIPLVLTGGMKSRNYDEANELYFDEAILLPHSMQHYLPDEATVWLEWLTTVFRDRVGNRAFMFGNNITYNDPVSMAWGLMPSGKEFTYYSIPGSQNKNICVWIKHNKELEEVHAAGDVGQLVGGSKYGRYAFGNEVMYGNDEFIAKRPEGCRFAFGIRYKGEVFGFWLDPLEGRLYVSKRYDSTSRMIYSLTRDDHTINTHLVRARGDAFFRIMAQYYAAGDMRFTDNYTKARGVEILGYFFQ